jgi:hypothetical protein
MQYDTRSQIRIVIGLAAAAGAVGMAAMMSAVTAPTARADDFSDVITNVDADYTDGTAALSTADTDFASNDFAGGLASLFAGEDDYGLAAPDDLFIGSTEVLTGESVTGPVPFTWAVPASFADAESAVQSFISEGEGYFTSAASAFASGDYGDWAYDSAIGLNLFTVDPIQELLLGLASGM